MIDTIMQRFSQYWDTFYNAPIEFQVIGGALTLGASYMLFDVSKKLWKLMLPARWVSAKALDGTSRLLYKPTKTIYDVDGTPPKDLDGPRIKKKVGDSLDVSGWRYPPDQDIKDLLDQDIKEVCWKTNPYTWTPNPKVVDIQKKHWEREASKEDTFKVGDSVTLRRDEYKVPWEIIRIDLSAPGSHKVYKLSLKDYDGGLHTYAYESDMMHYVDLTTPKEDRFQRGDSVKIIDETDFKPFRKCTWIVTDWHTMGNGYRYRIENNEETVIYRLGKDLQLV